MSIQNKITITIVMKIKHTKREPNQINNYFINALSRALAFD